MAIAAATHVPTRSMTLIATPWRFSGFPDSARAALQALWVSVEPAAKRLGLLPMEVLQTAFWQLDPARTVAKYADFSRMDSSTPEAALFIAMEDWANGGSPLPLAAGREMLEDFFATDLPGSGAWEVGGRVISPEALPCPVLDIISSTDRIVPAASASGRGTGLMLSQGHVGMIVGGQAKSKLWEPLRDWLVNPTSVHSVHRVR
jgi:polyhydroxyalkanoate synthase subunit PhaC